jgi:hypothetical protein
MPLLRCSKITFSSQLDEELFFVGLKRISAVKKIEGTAGIYFFQYHHGFQGMRFAN